MAWWQVALQVVQYMQTAYEFNEAYERDDEVGMASSAASMLTIKEPESVGEGLKAVAMREYPTEVKQIGAAITGKSIGGAAKEMVKAEFPRISHGMKAAKELSSIGSSKRLLVTEEEEED